MRDSDDKLAFVLPDKGVDCFLLNEIDFKYKNTFYAGLWQKLRDVCPLSNLITLLMRWNSRRNEVFGAVHPPLQRGRKVGDRE